MNIRLGFPLLCAALACASCSYTPFTTSIRRNNALDAAQVKKIQFYTSGEIVLRRKSVQEFRGGVKGRLTSVDEVLLHEIVISSNTPCVALRLEQGDGAHEFVLVSFSKRDGARQALWFSTRNAAVPGRYQLDWIEDAAAPGAFQPKALPGYQVKYGDDYYEVVEGYDVYLTFEWDSEFEQDETRTSPDGWRL